MQALAMLGKTLLIAVTLGLVVLVSLSKKRNPLSNPFILIVMCSLTTLACWLAVLGVTAWLSGSYSVAVSPGAMVVGCLLSGILLLGLSLGSQRGASGLLLVPGVLVLLAISYAAATGLTSLSNATAAAAALPLVIASLALAFAVYVAVAIQRIRLRGGDASGNPDAARQDHPGRQDSV